LRRRGDENDKRRKMRRRGEEGRRGLKMNHGGGVYSTLFPKENIIIIFLGSGIKCRR